MLEYLYEVTWRMEHWRYFFPLRMDYAHLCIQQPRDVGLRRILCTINVPRKVLVYADAIIFSDSLWKRVRRLHFGCF